MLARMDMANDLPPIPLRALLTGRVAPLGAGGVTSGIAKLPAAAPLMLREDGLVGDEQGDLRHHGGPEKALHHYPFDHYAGWADEIGAKALLAAAGAFGENLSTLGLTEREVAVGDVFRLGQAVIEVSQGRQPCWKLNRRFGVPDMSRRVQDSGRTGWYYRVIEGGRVAPDAVLTRIDRRAPDWTIDRLSRALYGADRDRGEWAAMAALDLAVETARSRTSKKTGRTYSQDPDIRWRVADMALAYDALPAACAPWPSRCWCTWRSSVR